MRQGWIQIAGLCADICGFMLIVSEWWNAVIKERAIELLHTAKRYEDVAAALAQATPRGALAARLLDRLMLALVEERSRALTRAQQLAEHNPVMVFRRRLRNFIAGATLVVAGFVLQVLSAIPGGAPAVGLLP